MITSSSLCAVARRPAWRWLGWAVIVAVALSAMHAVVATAASTGTRLKARVNYQARPCSGSADRLRVPKPAIAGTLVLRRAGTTKRISLLPTGTSPATFTLPGRGRITATLELLTPRVRVTDPAGRLRRVPLRVVSNRNGRVTFSVRGEDNNADVNTLIALQRAARVAAASAPRQLPRVTAHLNSQPLPDGEVYFDSPTTIQIQPDGGAFDPRWEPTPLIHEYGHFVLHQLGAEGPDGGEHDLNKSYPARPTLAWNEGFATAFAGLVLKEGRGLLTFRCSPYAHLGVQPARPDLASDLDRRYAQYSETRVAGAVYQSVGQLGGGEAGLKRLLAAVRTYRRAGHSVWTARDLRDLLVQSFERSAADQAAFYRIFFGQGIAWDRRVTAGIPASDPEFERITQAWASLTVRVEGPGGLDCRTNVEIDASSYQLVDGAKPVIGAKRADGGLTFSGMDDCYLVSGIETIDFVKTHSFGGDAAEIPFPYAAGGAHWNGEYSVYAKFVCEYEPTSGPGRYCPTGKQVLVTADNAITTLLVPSLRQSILVTLPRSVETKIATFTADGKCLVSGFDCGI